MLVAAFVILTVVVLLGSVLAVLHLQTEGRAAPPLLLAWSRAVSNNCTNSSLELPIKVRRILPWDVRILARVEMKVVHGGVFASPDYGNVEAHSKACFEIDATSNRARFAGKSATRKRERRISAMISSSTLLRC